MFTIRRILCPVDLSPDSAEALRYALALVRAYDAKLLLCHCVENQNPHASGAAQSGPERVRTRFAELLAAHMSDDAARVEVEVVVVEGGEQPASAITREAAERGVDLIVMRSRRRPRAAALLGSTAEAVCRTAPCPVFVTHPREREWVGQSASEFNLRRILVAYDFSDDAELALRYGLSLAQGHQTELHLLHILQKPTDEGPEIAWTVASTESVYQHAARRLQKAVPAEAQLWCEIAHAVRWGKPYREVLAYAAEHEIDLVCMGAKGAGFGLSALFGSNVDRVLRQAPCPVLVARPLRPATAPATPRAALSFNSNETKLSAVMLTPNG